MGAFEAIKAAIVLVAGAALGWLLCSLYAGLVEIPAAREAGRVEERLVWQTRQAEAERQIAADRDAAQARIDAVERDYHERERSRALQVDALEQALQQEQADASPSADRACVPRPAIPRGVRDALDAAGRRPAAARPDPAEPPSAVR